jgi:hypothetical protein
MIFCTTLTIEKPYDFNPIIEQIPQITIVNGEASTAEAKAYTIIDMDTKNPFAIIYKDYKI